MIEEWKPVLNYEGYYEVSSLGNIRSVDRIIQGRNQVCTYNIFRKATIMKSQEGPDGYMRIELCKSGTHKTFLVHRLVAQAFILNDLNLPEVNHKDRNKQNNCVDNLEWCSKLDNMRHAMKTGFDPGSSNRGKQFSEEHKAKISKALTGRVMNDTWRANLKSGHTHQQKSVMCVEDNLMFDSYSAAGQYYHIDSTTVSESIKHNRTTKIGKTFVTPSRSKSTS